MRISRCIFGTYVQPTPVIPLGPEPEPEIPAAFRPPVREYVVTCRTCGATWRDSSISWAQDVDCTCTCRAQDEDWAGVEVGDDGEAL